jgi:hypothetical protein
MTILHFYSFAHSPRHTPSHRERGENRKKFLSPTSLPIEADEQITAALAIAPGTKTSGYSASDISLMRDLGARIGKSLRAKTTAARVNDTFRLPARS